MAFETVRQIFSGEDRLSSTLKKMSRSMFSLGEEIQDTGDKAITTTGDFRTLDETINKAAPFKETEQFEVLGEAIDKVSRDAQEGIFPLEELRNVVQVLGVSADMSEDDLSKLSRNLEAVFKAGLDARISVGAATEIIEELGRDSDLSASQLEVLNVALEQIADGEDIVSMQMLNEEIEQQAAIAGLDATAMHELNQEWKQGIVNVTGLSAALTPAQTQLLGLSGITDESSDEFSEFQREIFETVGSLVGLDAKVLTTAGFLKLLDATVDDVEGEFNRFSRAMDDLFPDDPLFTTLNLGPVNISLKNLATTIVSLTTLLGPLIVTVGALAGTLAALTAAIGSFLGVGLVQFLDRIDQQFAGIEGRAEALEALTKGLGRALRDALSPIEDSMIAGQTPIEFFINTIRAGLRFVEDFARVIANISGMREIRSFLSRISDALFTADPGVSMLDAIRGSIEKVLPMITDFFVFLINNLPEFIKFSNEIAEQVGPALGRMFITLLPAMAQLVRFGAELFDIFSHLVVIAGQAVGVLAKVFDAVNNLLGPSVELGDITEKIIALFIAVSGVYVALATVLGKLATMYEIIIGLKTIATGATIKLAAAVKGLNISLGTTVTLLSTVAKILGLIALAVGAGALAGKLLRAAGEDLGFARAPERRGGGPPGRRPGRRADVNITIQGDVENPRRFGRKVRDAQRRANRKERTRSTGSARPARPR